MLTVHGLPDVGAPPTVPAEPLSAVITNLPAVIALAAFLGMAWYLARGTRKTAAREKVSRR